MSPIGSLGYHTLSEPSQTGRIPGERFREFERIDRRSSAPRRTEAVRNAMGGSRDSREPAVNGVGRLVKVAGWVALCAGFAEVGIRALQQLVFHRVVYLSPAYVWMVPLGDLIVMQLAVLLLLALGVFWPRLRSVQAATFVSCFLGFLSLLLMVPWLHCFAAAIAAAGFASAAARFAAARPAAFPGLIRRTGGWMAGVLLALAVGVHTTQFVRGRVALRRLPAATAGAPNVLLIILDTVRAASLSLYGYTRPTSPVLAREARQGVVFANAISTAPWTLPSHASIFTGRLPHELSVGWDSPLDATYPTLAEIFRDHGYLTAGVVANVLYCSYEHGLSRGFIYYDDYRTSIGRILASATLLRAIVNSPKLRRLIQNDQPIDRRSASEINRDFLRWLERTGEGDARRPFFAFLNYFDAHGPYLPPPPFDRQFGPGRSTGSLSWMRRRPSHPEASHPELPPQLLREEIDAYDGALVYLDQELGSLLATLKRRGVLANTLVVVTSDHGEEFGEHGVFEHGNSLYRPSVQVPLILLFPGRVPAGRIVEDPVSLRDLPATILRVAGLSQHSGIPGVSLTELWADPTRPRAEEPSPVVSEVAFARGHPSWYPVTQGGIASLIASGWRYIRTGDGREDLYDFLHDPWEQRDMAEQVEARPTLERLRRDLAAFESPSSPASAP